MAICDIVSLCIEQFSYIAITLLILIGSLGIPLPEEVVLLITGYLASLGWFKLKYAVAAALIGTLIGDNLGYYLGHAKGRKYLLKWGKFLFIPRERLKSVEKYFKKHGGKTVFLSRFVLGIRFLGPMIAGSSKMKWSRFFVYNLLAAVIWIPLITILGFLFGANYERLIANLQHIKNFLFITIVAVVLLYILNKIYNHNTNQP